MGNRASRVYDPLEFTQTGCYGPCWSSKTVNEDKTEESSKTVNEDKTKKLDKELEIENKTKELETKIEYLIVYTHKNYKCFR